MDKYVGQELTRTFPGKVSDLTSMCHEVASIAAIVSNRLVGAAPQPPAVPSASSPTQNCILDEMEAQMTSAHNALIAAREDIQRLDRRF